MKTLGRRLNEKFCSWITRVLSRFPSRPVPQEEYLVTFNDRETGRRGTLILSADHVGPFHRCGRYSVVFVQPLRHLRP